MQSARVVWLATIKQLFMAFGYHAATEIQTCQFSRLHRACYFSMDEQTDRLMYRAHFWHNKIKTRDTSSQAPINVWEEIVGLFIFCRL